MGRGPGGSSPPESTGWGGSSPESCLIALGRSRKPGDEEARGAVAVGPQLQAAALGGRREGRSQGAEIVELQRRGVTRLGSAQQRLDLVLVLAAGDRAGRVDEGAAGPQNRGGVAQQRALDLDQPADRLRRLAPAGVGAGGEGTKVRAGRVEQDPVEAGP